MARWKTCVWVGLLVGCQSSEMQTPSAPEPVEAPVPQVAEPEPPVSKVNADCVHAARLGEVEPLTIRGQSWERNGSTLSYRGKKMLQWRVGAISDIKEDSPENLKNLKKIAKWMRKQRADAVFVLGDSGENSEQMEAALSILAKTGVALFVVIGNREGQQAYAKALSGLQETYPNVFDLNHVRRIDTPIVDVYSLPGYYDSKFIHGEDGCQYGKPELDALAGMLKIADSPIALVSHGGPRQKGPQALDRISEGKNVGDPSLAKVMSEAGVAFGLFGNVHEAGGYGSTLEGKRLPARKWHKELLVNPGPADGVRWLMNDKRESVGMAAMVTFSAKGEAKYDVLRLK